MREHCVRHTTQPPRSRRRSQLDDAGGHDVNLWLISLYVSGAKLACMGGERGNRLTRTGAALLRVRWFVRAPIWLYRARLGIIFGHRLLMLEHVGRRTARRRFVVLEVVDHPTPHRYVVVSGFGTRSQWFRNVEAHPLVRVYLASHPPELATAQRLDAAAGTAALERYAGAHPRAWAKLRPVLEDTLGTRIDEHSAPPMIALDLAVRSDHGGTDATP